TRAPCPLPLHRPTLLSSHRTSRPHLASSARCLLLGGCSLPSGSEESKESLRLMAPDVWLVRADEDRAGGPRGSRSPPSSAFPSSSAAAVRASTTGRPWAGPAEAADCSVLVACSNWCCICWKP